MLLTEPKSFYEYWKKKRVHKTKVPDGPDLFNQ